MAELSSIASSSRSSSRQNHRIAKFLQSENKSYIVKLIAFTIYFTLLVLLANSTFAYITITNQNTKSSMIFETLNR